MKLNKLISIFLILIFSVNAQDNKESFKFGVGIQNPYTIFKNPTNGFFYIGNVKGAPHLNDNNSDIAAIWFKDFKAYRVKAKVTPPISSEYPKTKLSSPTGMVILDGHLIIADVDSLAIFKQEEKKRPEQIAHFKVKGAEKLEGIVVVDGDIYLSDSGIDSILKITDFFDKEKRDVSRVAKIKSPKGMIYDKDNNSLLIVSSKINKLYELSLVDVNKSKTFTIGPKSSEGGNGFFDLCMGNQRELYLTNYMLGKVFIYFRNQDRPKAITKPMKYAVPFIKKANNPTGIIYDSEFNRIIFAEYFSNTIQFHKGLKPQLTMEEIKKKIDLNID